MTGGATVRKPTRIWARRGHRSRASAWLEAEAIFIMREEVSEFARPVMLCSVRKDSSVMLHLARKEFFPLAPTVSGETAMTLVLAAQ